LFYILLLCDLWFFRYHPDRHALCLLLVMGFISHRGAEINTKEIILNGGSNRTFRVWGLAPATMAGLELFTAPSATPSKNPAFSPNVGALSSLLSRTFSSRYL